jgi:hypothetical protein
MRRILLLAIALGFLATNLLAQGGDERRGGDDRRGGGRWRENRDPSSVVLEHFTFKQVEFETLSAVLKENGIEHTFHLIEGGEHSWSGGSVQKALLESLQFVSAGFSKAKPSDESKPPPAEAAPKKPAGGQ